MSKDHGLAGGHTPRPWTTDRVAWDDDGPGADAIAVSGAKWGSFAKVVVRLFAEDYDHPTGVANARLIASAPDLLEALRPFSEVLADVGGDEDDEDLYRTMTKAYRLAPAITVGHLRAAQAAILKATTPAEPVGGE